MGKHNLDPEFKERWIAALESGKFRQGQSRLVSDDKERFCCLGVACVVGGLEMVHPEDCDWRWGFSYNGQIDMTALPSGFAKSIGLDGRETSIVFTPDSEDLAEMGSRGVGYHDIHGNYCVSLMSLNDSGKYDFKFIAKMIRKYL